MQMIPDWPAPAHVRAICTTRFGGASLPPYDSLNLGDHVGDDPAHVAANRAWFEKAIGARPVFLNQVHGTQVLQLEKRGRYPFSLWRKVKKGSVPFSLHASQADACITHASGVACTVMVADCLPVLFTTEQGDWVAAAHAGWRGLAGQGGVGVLETTLKRVKRGSVPFSEAQEAAKIIAWLGPCIGPDAFEVGGEVRAAFVATDAQAAQCFTALAGGKWLADLAGLARLRLRAAGVTQVFGNDSSAAWCTFANASRFFSHRRDRVTGRFAASVWRLP
ncbi:MAG: laccase [Comamonadaceae bacterium CG1_02_60_18]|nr:MAG: laccase [Comamonadaceae bacterium CG1_02_60_18]PIQ51830.1 MAG: laccase [Comamonadaceae bacterium CG12_big_fil_rev_8_21_14_0_65_59_15]